MSRTYELKARAERMEETRHRIAAATWELHREVGPAQTTISAIAERAGVQRLTVYRHFPDELSLFRACAQHDFETHPPPDPERWRSIADPRERLRTGLAELYAYYQQTEEITAKVLRDAPTLPALQQVVAERFGPLVGQTIHALSPAWEIPEALRTLQRAAIGHAVDFHTWRSLVRDQSLADDQAVALMVALVHCAAGSAV